MAVAIVKNLSPDPRKTPIPGDVRLKQTLISDQNGEVAIAELRLAGGHDIWFRLPDGTPSKSITFQRDVGSENSKVTYDVSLLRHVGTSLDGTFGIDQTVTDESGLVVQDHCTVVIS